MDEEEIVPTSDCDEREEELALKWNFSSSENTLKRRNTIGLSNDTRTGGGTLWSLGSYDGVGISPRASQDNDGGPPRKRRKLIESPVHDHTQMTPTRSTLLLGSNTSGAQMNTISAVSPHKPDYRHPNDVAPTKHPTHSELPYETYQPFLGSPALHDSISVDAQDVQNDDLVYRQKQPPTVAGEPQIHPLFWDESPLLHDLPTTHTIDGASALGALSGPTKAQRTPKEQSSRSLPTTPLPSRPPGPNPRHSLSSPIITARSTSPPTSSLLPTPEPQDEEEDPLIAEGFGPYDDGTDMVQHNGMAASYAADVQIFKTPSKRKRSLSIPSRASPVDPLSLFASRRQNVGDADVHTPPRTPVLAPIANRIPSPHSDPPSSPLTPVQSPEKPSGPMTSPVRSVSSGHNSSPPRQDNHLEDQLHQDSEHHARYSLRTRQAKQVKPYAYDRLLYKQQLRANPDAIVNAISPRRRRGSPRLSSDREMSSDAEAVPVESEEDDDDFERRRRRRDKGSVSGSRSPTRHRSRSKTLDRARRSTRSRSSERPGSPSKWYPAALQETFSSSSSEDDEIMADLKKLRDEASKKPKAHRRRRRKPFPLGEDELLGSTSRGNSRTASEPITGPSRVAASHSHHSPSPTRSLSPQLDPVPSEPDPLSPNRSINLADLPASDAELPPMSSSLAPNDFEGPSIEGNPYSQNMDVIDITDSSDADVNESQDEDSSSPGSSDADEAAEDRRKARLLSRMMPAVLIKKLTKEAERQAPGNRHATTRRHDEDEDEDDERPLQPGQTRVRLRELSRTTIDIRGDPESSDVDVLASPSGSRSRSPSVSSHVLSLSSDVESDVGGNMRHRRRPVIDLLTSSSEEEDEGTVDDVDDIEIGDWVSGAVRRDVNRTGEAKEGDLIDRMLSRTRTGNSKRKAKTTRRSGIGVRALRHFKQSGRSHRIVTGGARMHGPVRQTLINFPRHSSSSTARKPYSKSSYAHTHRDGSVQNIEEETYLVEDPRDDAQPLHRQIDDRDVSSKFTLQQKERKKARKGAGFYVFTSGGKQVTSGRMHPHAVTVDAEDETISSATHFAHNPVGHVERVHRHSHSTHRVRPRRGPIMRLEDYWHGDGAIEQPLPVDGHVEPQGEVNVSHQVKVDCDISSLLSGIAFAPNTYLGKRWLQELLSCQAGNQDVIRPSPITAFDVNVSTFSTPEDFAIHFETISNKLIDTVSDASQPLSSIETNWQFQGTLHSICQHVTWYLSNCDDDGRSFLRTGIEDHLRRTSSLVEEKFAVLSDDSRLNLMVFELQWFAVELSWRMQPLLETSLSPAGPTTAFHHAKLLLRHLWAFGLDRPVQAIKAIGPDDADRLDSSYLSQRVAELWVCLIHLTHHWDTMSISKSVHFWDILQLFVPEDLQRTSRPALEVSELNWRNIYSLCALSQFSTIGITTSSPRLLSSWQFIATILERVPLSADPDIDKRSTRRALRKRDKYIRLLVTRCMHLNTKWKWDLDNASRMFNQLLNIFKSRRFANLSDEQADFPSFLRYNNLLYLYEQKASDTAFTMFLKLVARAAKDANQVETSGGQSRLSSNVKKILSLIVPVGSVPFTKATPPKGQELSMLYNRFSAVSVAILLEPSPQNAKYRLAHARRYVEFKNIDQETRRACIRGVMHLTIVLQHLRLPLEDVLNWLGEMSNTLIDEYQDVKTAATASNGSLNIRARNCIVLSIQMLLRSVCHIIKTPTMNPEEDEPAPQYPNPALLQGPWVTRVFSTHTDLTTIVTTGFEIRKLVLSFLHARRIVVPPPQRPSAATMSSEESQESQEDYGQFDFDLNDPEVLAMLDNRPSMEDIRTKEEVVCKLIDEHIVSAIYRLVCKNICDPAHPPSILDRHSKDADEWIECWVGCASVLVQNGRKSWDFYLELGNQSWNRIIDPSWRRYVGLRFMFQLLQVDPSAYESHQDSFLRELMECLVAITVTIQPEYAALVLSIDGLHHPLLRDLPINREDRSIDYDIPAPLFLESRLSWIKHIMSHLSGSLTKEAAGELSLYGQNQKYVELLVTMFSSMRAIFEGLAPESIERAAYIQFCRDVSQSLSQFPNLNYHSRLHDFAVWLHHLS